MDISKSQSAYLKLIFEYEEQNKSANNKDIADELDVSPPSVSEMLKRLRSQNLLDKDRIELTQHGREIAKKIISVHRLWETFLIEKLGYGWEEVHDDASRLELIMSEKLVTRLNAALAYPTVCPHGKTIYINHPEVVRLKTLFDYGQTGLYCVKQVTDDVPLLKYLKNKNIRIGSLIEVCEVNTYDRTMSVRVKDQACELSEKVTKNIRVLPVEEETHA